MTKRKIKLKHFFDSKNLGVFFKLTSFSGLESDGRAKKSVLSGFSWRCYCLLMEFFFVWQGGVEMG